MRLKEKKKASLIHKILVQSQDNKSHDKLIGYRLISHLIVLCFRQRGP